MDSLGYAALQRGAISEPEGIQEESDLQNEYGTGQRTRNIPIFADLSDEKLGWLADHASVETEPRAGEIVIRENEPRRSRW